MRMLMRILSSCWISNGAVHEATYVGIIDTDHDEFKPTMMIRKIVLTCSTIGLFITLLLFLSLFAKPLYFLYAQNVLGSFYTGDEVFHEIIKVIGYIMAPISLIISVVANSYFAKKI